jgi:hypothetical protein
MIDQTSHQYCVTDYGTDDEGSSFLAPLFEENKYGIDTGG